MLKCRKKQCSALKIKKAFQRIKDRRGSVLFFIVAVMAILVVLASAVYYSVTSAHKQVEVRYEGEQSYQSALALNDIITQYINTRTEDPFIDAIIGLNETETLTTDGDAGAGFTELAAGMGDYKVTVKKLKGSGTDEMQTIQIETEVNVNGEKSVVTTIGEFSLVSKPYSFDRFFTSTGYAPNDVIMSGMNVTSTMYLDNEYSQIGSGQGGNSGINIKAEVISAGTLSINNAPINADGDKTFDITVGNNLYMTFEGGQGAMNLNGGRIRVGGSLIQGASFNYANDTDVYVVGDFICGRNSENSNCEIYVNGDAAFYANNTFNGPVYVNGDVFIDPAMNVGDKFPGGIKVGGSVYLSSTMQNLENFKNKLISKGIAAEKIKTYTDPSNSISFVVGTQEQVYDKLRTTMDKVLSLAGEASAYEYVWPSDTFVCESLQNVRAKINEKLGNPEYSNWDMRKKFVNADGSYVYEPISFNFNNSALPQDTDARFANSGSTKNQMIVRAQDFGEYVIMGDVRITNGGDWEGNNIIFDTTMPDGKDKDMYVYLPANCKMAKNPANDWQGPYLYSNAEADKAEFNCFRWNNQPTGAFAGWFSVLTKGKGSVIFVIDDNVTYLAQERLVMCHYNLLKEIVPNAIQADGKILNTNGFSEDKVANIMNEKAIFKQTVIDKYASSGGLHNNIFMVAINKNSDVNFDAQYNTFCGFLYAPYMTFGAGKSTEGHFAMLGGLIVSDYTMPNTSRTYMATLPYDYYDRFVDPSITDPDKKEEARMKYMEKLISNSGGEIGTLGSSSSRSWRKYGYN